MGQPGHILPDGMSEEGRQVTRSLYAILAQVLSGRSLSLLRLIPDQNGLRAWKELKSEFEPQSGNRVAGVLRALLNPQHTWQRELSAGVDFLECLTRWEYLIGQYRLLSGEQLSDAILVAVVLEHAPEHLGELLRRSHDTVRASYAGLKAHLREYHQRLAGDRAWQ
eukprot:4227502-Amphidinium_carterae.1